MKPPFICFSDGGVSAYATAETMCSHIENWIVEKYPEWCRGYDADGTPFKLVIGARIPKVELDSDAQLDTNEDERESMIEFLTHEVPSDDASKFANLTNRELFARVVAVGIRQIESTPPPPERSIDLTIGRAFGWMKRIFRNR